MRIMIYRCSMMIMTRVTAMMITWMTRSISNHKNNNERIRHLILIWCLSLSYMMYPRIMCKFLWSSRSRKSWLTQPFITSLSTANCLAFLPTWRLMSINLFHHIRSLDVLLWSYTWPTCFVYCLGYYAWVSQRY